MTFWTVVGIILVLAFIACVGVLSGRKVQDSKDFLTGGGQAGPWLVCGTIMGSLVSSQATIGTAQLAFNYGLAAWWFTLGSGIGCLILAVGYAARLRGSGCVTELQVISSEFGPLSGTLGSLLCSIGIFISVLAQVVACIGLLSTLFPHFSAPLSAAVAIGLMMVYVIFGGAWGAGMGGMVKLILLCAVCVVGMAYVMAVDGGPSGLIASVGQALEGTALGGIQPQLGMSALDTAADLGHRFMNLTARGAAKDIGSGISLLLGVLSTQTYAQAIWSAKSTQAAKRGALTSALLIPLIGIAGISIGLFMRGHYITRDEAALLAEAGTLSGDVPILESTIQVLPVFVMDQLPPLFAGIVLGTLLITVVGGGAGLSLGMATIMLKDIYKRVTKRIDTPEKELMASRLTIAGILVAAAVLAATSSSSTINDLGFLSMGLRGTVVFIPMTLALWVRGKVDPRAVVVSIVASPLAVLVGQLCALSFDPLFLGIGISALCCTGGWIVRRRSGL